jgi:hypothetical protein
MENKKDLLTQVGVSCCNGTGYYSEASGSGLGERGLDEKEVGYGKIPAHQISIGQASTDDVGQTSAGRTAGHVGQAA